MKSASVLNGSVDGKSVTGKGSVNLGASAIQS